MNVTPPLPTIPPTNPDTHSLAQRQDNLCVCYSDGAACLSVCLRDCLSAFLCVSGTLFTPHLLTQSALKPQSCCQRRDAHRHTER